jgi:hypothetical protein
MQDWKSRHLALLLLEQLPNDNQTSTYLHPADLGLILNETHLWYRQEEV